MRNNSQDKTMYRNYINQWKHLIKEYELIKNKKHPTLRFVSDFYKYHHTNRQTFLKYYHRYLSSNKDINSVIPQTRGPKRKQRNNNRNTSMLGKRR